MTNAKTLPVNLQNLEEQVSLFTQMFAQEQANGNLSVDGAYSLPGIYTPEQQAHALFQTLSVLVNNLSNGPVLVEVLTEQQILEASA